MYSKILYSEYLKDKFIRELKAIGCTLVSVEKDFVGVWTVRWCL